MNNKDISVIAVEDDQLMADFLQRAFKGAKSFISYPNAAEFLAGAEQKKASLWAACLARVFEVYPLLCPKCNLEMKPVAVMLSDKELVRLLTHLGLPAEFPKFRPAPQALLYEHDSGPPEEDCQPDPKGALYEVIEPAPADD